MSGSDKDDTKEEKKEDKKEGEKRVRPPPPTAPVDLRASTISTWLIQNIDKYSAVLFQINAVKGDGTANPNFIQMRDAIFPQIDKWLPEILGQLEQKKGLSLDERTALENYFNKNRQNFNHNLTAENFVSAATIDESGGLQVLKKLSEIKTGGGDMDETLIVAVALLVRIASHLDRSKDGSFNARYFDLTCVAFLNLFAQRLQAIAHCGTPSVYSHTGPVTDAAMALRPTKCMFKWFEEALLSWGLSITSQGLTYHVELEPGHRRDNQYTNEKRAMWKDFARDPANVSTFALLVIVAKVGEANDFSPNGLDEFNGWSMALKSYSYFKRSPRLARHKSHEQILKYIQLVNQYFATPGTKARAKTLRTVFGHILNARPKI